MLADNLAMYIEESGMTYSELAEKCGVSDTYLCDLRNGKYKNPSLKILKKIADGLGKQVTDLLK